ncbi:trichohyalin-like [Folsomia candida]|nr:trichohyalin-like [Folsomia candida]
MEAERHAQLRREQIMLEKEAKNYPERQRRYEATLSQGKSIQRRKRNLAMVEYDRAREGWTGQIASLNSTREAARVAKLAKNAELEAQRKNKVAMARKAKLAKLVVKEDLDVKTICARDNKLAAIKDKRNEKDEIKKFRWEAMLTSMQTHADQAACAKEVALIERARRVEIREAKIEQQRKRLPMMIQERKLREERLQRIVRKYALLWLRKVREKLKKEKLDAAHVSSFEVERSLAIWVGQLEEATGIGKPGGPLAGFDFKTFMQNVKKAKNNNTGKMSRKISHVSNKFEQDSGAENEDEDEDEEEMI